MTRYIVLVLSAVGTAVALAGCGMFLSGAQPLTPPAISNVQIQPTRLRFSGGQVILTADVRDSSGVRAVTLAIQNPDGSTTTVAMEPAGADAYRATVSLPLNVSASTQRYSFVVNAENVFGVKSQSTVTTLEVEGVSFPPDTPPI